MYDYHIHSNFSIDSKADMHAICRSAISKHLEGICFTDHIDIDSPEFDIKATFPYYNYSKTIHECKNCYKDFIEVYIGIELGLQPHVIEHNMNFLNNKYFDFVIGSIHSVNKKEMYGLYYLEGLSDDEAIDLYFDNLIECIDQFNNFDVLGHIDVFRRYLSQEEKNINYRKYEDKLEFILNKLINMGKGIEINTSAIRYKLSSFHPVNQIVKLYKSLKGEIITIGSDSHNPSHLGYMFGDAMNLLKDNNFSYYTIFINRKPHFKKIED